MKIFDLVVENGFFQIPVSFPDKPPVLIKSFNLSFLIYLESNEGRHKAKRLSSQSLINNDLQLFDITGKPIKKYKVINANDKTVYENVQVFNHQWIFNPDLSPIDYEVINKAFPKPSKDAPDSYNINHFYRYAANISVNPLTLTVLAKITDVYRNPIKYYLDENKPLFEELSSIADIELEVLQYLLCLLHFEI